VVVQPIIAFLLGIYHPPVTTHDDSFFDLEGRGSRVCVRPLDNVRGRATFYRGYILGLYMHVP
jgi:hypothetical protein